MCNANERLGGSSTPQSLTPEYPGFHVMLQPRDYNTLERRGLVHVENQCSEEPDHLHKVVGTDMFVH